MSWYEGDEDGPSDSDIEAMEIDRLIEQADEAEFESAIEAAGQEERERLADEAMCSECGHDHDDDQLCREFVVRLDGLHECDCCPRLDESISRKD
jgi:hypothetical protein